MSKELYQDKTGLSTRREWRGVRDTAYDFYRWCVNWKDMIKFVMRSPVQIVKGLFKYRWMATYLTVPAFVDRQLEGCAAHSCAWDISFITWWSSTPPTLSVCPLTLI